jgi:hypothetical protein
MGAHGEVDGRLLSQEAFEFVLNNELKRAIRSQTFLTLVVVEAHEPEEDRGPIVPSLDAVTHLVSREVRETDLLARTDRRTLSMVLLDADLDSSLRVIDRLMSRLAYYDFHAPVSIAVGAACCPTHAVDAESLRRQATSYPVLTHGPGERHKVN